MTLPLPSPPTDLSALVSDPSVSPRLSADTVAALRRAVRGRLLFPRDAGFLDATRDLGRTRLPGVVVEVADARDAVTVIRLANERGETVTDHRPRRGSGGIFVSAAALRSVEVVADGIVRMGVSARDRAHDDAVLAVELVTWDADLHRVDAESEPAVVSALLGGATELGFVTALDLRVGDRAGLG